MTRHAQGEPLFAPGGIRFIGPEDRFEACARVLHDHAIALHGSSDVDLMSWDNLDPDQKATSRTYVVALEEAGLLVGGTRRPRPGPIEFDEFGTPPLPFQEDS